MRIHGTIKTGKTARIMPGDVNSEKACDEQERHSTRNAWRLYLLQMRIFLAWLERQYEKLGAIVTSRPITTIFIAFLGVSICAIGLVRLNVETKSSKLFVPQNSASFKALEDGKTYFYNSMNMRQEEVIFEPRNGNDNMFSSKALEDAYMAMQKIEDITGYRKLCKKRPDFIGNQNDRSSHDCMQINILELLGNTTHPMDRVYDRIMSAKLNVSILMSNGRNFDANKNEMLSKFNISTANRRVSAKALRMIIFMQQGQNTTHENSIMEWENSFISTMNDLKSQLKNVEIYFSAERSMDDSISDSSSADFSLISITFTVMITFACLMLAKFVNPIRGHNWLAMSGVFSTALGILAGIGATVAFGVPFISLVGVVPFLVVSIGIDDMFILVDEFDRQPDKIAPKDRVKFTLSKVGATITMTTLTDVIAFFITTSTSFPAIRYFCIYVAMCISIEFLLQITLFVAFLTFDSIRIFENRCDLLPLRRVRDRSHCQVTSSPSLADRIMHQYAKLLLMMPSKLFVIASSICLISYGIYGCFNIDNEFNKKSLALPGSHFLNYIANYEKKFPQTIPVSIQITTKVNYSDQNVRNEIAKSAKIAYSTGYYLPQNISWVMNFHDYVKRYGKSANGADFKPAITAFLSVPQYRQHRLDVILDKSNNIVASRVIVFYKDNVKSEFQKDAMLKLRSELQLKLNIDVTVAADPFIYFEQFAAVVDEVIRNLVPVAAVIIIVMMPFIIHPLIILILVLCFVALIVELFGLMHLWSVQLNSLSMITLVMAIGFTVDYSSHVAHAFVTSREDLPDRRIIHALGSVGSSVLLGAVSTFIGMSLTGFAKSTIFKIFFKMFVGIILFGLYNGVVLLPVLLSFLGKWLSTDLKRVSIHGNKSRNSDRKKRITQPNRTSVSILGMSLMFPQAKSQEQFWKILKDGVNTVGEYPKNRVTRHRKFDMRFNPSKAVPGKHYVLHGSFLESIDGFDYKFFGISKAEAISMDPQQRLLLQGTYEAIEDAGMTIEELQQCCTGVYTGLMNMDFNSVIFWPDSVDQIDQFAAIGSTLSITANRISFAFNLNGPSIALDTACSSSLTALTLACDHIEKGIIDVAIVGAANILLDELKHISICKANMLSPDGKCKAFDESADGYGRGEGVAVFILKATDYVVNREETHGEIISWAANNDGQSAAPMTAPSSIGQTLLMDEVIQSSGVDPNDIQYVELHGTGTFIGDLVETRSVGEVYGRSRDLSNPLIIGSVKSNINHTESTAGLAGIAKVCLMMEHEEFVPTTGIQNQASRLGLEEKGLVINTELCHWKEKSDGTPRLAAINSFGFGGSNAHVIIREREKPRGIKHDPSELLNAVRMLVLSTKSLQTLVQMAKDCSMWLTTVEDTIINQVNICYSLSERRTHHAYRLVVSSNSLKETSLLLQSFVENPDMNSVGICNGKANVFSSKVGFVFGGQGSQWFGMAGDLLSNDKLASMIRHVDHEIKKADIKTSVIGYLRALDERQDNESLVTIQLSIFALQYAVVHYLQSTADIQPLAVTGHSLGDITAACIAGIITLRQAIEIIHVRAKMQDKCQRNGAMAAIGFSVEETSALIEKLGFTGKLCIAAENDKNNVTLSGDEEAIINFEDCVKRSKENAFIRRIDTKKAFHSHHMDDIITKFMKKLGKTNTSAKCGNIKFFSTTEGCEVAGGKIQKEFWWRNLRNPVLFNSSIKNMMKDGIRTFIEISPRPVVSHYIKEIAKQSGTKDVVVIQALPKKGESERLKHLHVQCIGKMFTLGSNISFNTLHDYKNATFIRYPKYPWDEQTLWPKDEFKAREKTTLLLGAPVSINKDCCVWENEIELQRFPYMKDHKQASLGTIFPGAGFIELALEAGIMTNKIQTILLRDVAFKNVMPLNENVLRKLKCTKQILTERNSEMFNIALVTDQGEVTLSTAEITILKGQDSDSTLRFYEAYDGTVNSDNTHCEQHYEGNLSFDDQTEHFIKKSPLLTTEKSLLQKMGLCEKDEVDTVALREFVTSSGFEYGERFSLAEKSWANTRVTMSKLKITNDLLKESADYIIHPTVIDACMQTVFALQYMRQSSSSASPPSTLPVGADEIRLYPIKRKFKCLYCIAMMDSDDENASHLSMIDESGNFIMKFKSFQVKEIKTNAREPLMEKSVYKLHWTKATEPLEQDRFNIDTSFVLISAENDALHQVAVSALQSIGINDASIASFFIAEPNSGFPIQERLLPLIDKAYSPAKKLLVLNMLPTLAYDIPLEATWAPKAEWLCFESSLEILKVLTALNISNGGVIAISYNVYGDLSLSHGVINPWGSISRGMTIAASLDVPQMIVSAAIDYKADTKDFIQLLLRVTKDTVEDRFAVSRSQVFEPIITRHNPMMKEERKAVLLRKQDHIYLSWSPNLQSYQVKRLTDPGKLPPGFVDVRVTHLSSAFGKTGKILNEVQRYESKQNLQCASGIIATIGEGTVGFKIGDEVVALYNSKWVKSKIRVHVDYVITKPSFLTKGQASVLLGTYAYAQKIANEIKRSGKDVHKMKIASSENDYGICSMIGKASEMQGIDVIWDKISNSKLNNNIMEEFEDCRDSIDCLVCSAGLHPGEMNFLAKNLKQDGLVLLVDLSGRDEASNLNFPRAGTMMKVTSTNNVRAEDLMEFMDVSDKLVPICKSLAENIESISLSTICTGTGTVSHFWQEEAFQCLELEINEHLPVYLISPGLDFQGLKEDRTYIVVGGARGIGLKTVEWMVRRGARTVIVIGVSALSSESQSKFTELEKNFDARVIHMRVNISKEEAKRSLNSLLDGLQPVAGIVNSAAIVDDKDVTSIDRNSYQKVMDPKVSGTLNLHNLIESRGEEVDFFILYSSLASIMGNRGQTSYASANEFLNGFADYQNRINKHPYFSVCWGAMGGAGMLDRKKKVAQVLEKDGIYQLDIDQGIKWMEDILTSGTSETCLCITDIDWAIVCRGASQSRQSSILFSAMVNELGSTIVTDEERQLDKIMKSTSKDTQEELLAELVRNVLVTFTGGSEEEIDNHVALFSYGVDSVGASFLKSRIFSELEVDLETFYFMLPETTVVALARTLLEKLNERHAVKPIHEEVNEKNEGENGFSERRHGSGRRFHSFRTVAPQEIEDDALILPDDYLTAVYDPPNAIAKIFVVHPSHRYAGVFQPLATGMKHQEVFSLYAFGSQNPGYLGTDIRSVKRLADSCVKLMLEVQPHGPYFIGGYSFGGVVAIEIATILQNMGEKVALLAMIDTLLWLPEAAYNSQALLGLGIKEPLKDGIKEQINAFFARMATSQLQMTTNQYNELIARCSIEEVADKLKERAAELDVDIIDTRELIESMLVDYEMSSRCTDEWYPPVDIYNGPFLYIKAATCLCQRGQTNVKCLCECGIGSAFERWSSILNCHAIRVQCDGDHYSMMDNTRGPNVGSVLSTVSCLLLRKILPRAGSIKMTANHKLAKGICKGHGLNVCMIRKSALGTIVSTGLLGICEKDKSLIFQCSNFPPRNVKIKVQDLVNIRKMDTMGLRNAFQSTDFSQLNLYSGICLQQLDRKVIFMCFNRSDVKYLTYVLEGMCNINLPF